MEKMALNILIFKSLKVGKIQLSASIILGKAGTPLNS
jgi:hypothetical protein